MIVAVIVPETPVTRRSHYLKVRAPINIRRRCACASPPMAWCWCSQVRRTSAPVLIKSDVAGCCRYARRPHGPRACRAGRHPPPTGTDVRRFLHRSDRNVRRACCVPRGAREDFRFGTRQCATRLANLPDDALTLRDGAVVAPHGRVPVATLVAQVGLDVVEAEAGAALDAITKKFSRHAFGAQFAEVRADPDLGTIRASRLGGGVRRWPCPEGQDRAQPASRRHHLRHRHGAAGGDARGCGKRTHRERQHGGAPGRTPTCPTSRRCSWRMKRTIPTSGRERGWRVADVGAAAAVANAVYQTGVRARRLPIRVEDVLT